MQFIFKAKPDFEAIDSYKILLNVGALMDIPTGRYIKGIKGENILNGGLSLLTAIVGRGNTFKSTIEHYMILSALDKIAASGNISYINTYDTEMNIQIERLETFSKKFKYLKDVDLFSNQYWNVTDKTNHLGNEWFKKLKDFIKNEKIKNNKQYTFETPILNKDGKPINIIFPTFGEIDSISEFETADIEEITDKNEIGESGGNTIYMRLGLAKTRLLMELPSLCNAGSHYIVMTAHLGDNINVATGPYNTPVKKLQHMKIGDKIKGVTEKFFFLPNIVWQTMNSSLLVNQNTKGPEYPKRRDDPEEGSSDLNIVTIKLLRNKNGPSGYSLDLIISQEEGVLPTLSEFHFIKNNDRFGLEGNNVNYNLILYPKVKLTRTTVRETIDNDPLLCRAIKITSDLLQMKQIYKTANIELPDLHDLYNKLDKKYGWEKLLNTRDYWTFNNYEHSIPFLSSMDILEMYYERYTPYWLS